MAEDFSPWDVDVTTDTVGVFAEGHRDRISRLVDEIGDRLTRIVNRDEQDQARLRTSRERTAREISGLRTARQAQHAYVNARTRSNRFADRQG